jgi:hypothetical protein
MNFTQAASRDSIGSQQGEDNSNSARSSFMGTNKSFSRSDKKVTVDKKILIKLINFLKVVVKELNVEMEEINTIEKFIQTEEFDNNSHSLLNENSLEEALELKDNFEKLRIENENNINKIKKLTINNNELNEKVVSLNELLKISLIEKDDLNNEMEKLKEELKVMNENRKIEKKEETFIVAYTDKEKEIENTAVEEKNINWETLHKNLGFFKDERTLKEIVSYLQPKEFYNLYYSSKSILSVFTKESLHTSILKYTIEMKNLEIRSIKSVDWIKEYEISEGEVERLVREYIQNNRVPGCELKGMLVKALAYIDKEIKKPLGVVQIPEKTGRKSSILGR